MHAAFSLMSENVRIFRQGNFNTQNQNKSSVGRFEIIDSPFQAINLQPPLDKIVQSGLAKLRVSTYYFSDPLFDEYELTTARATWDFAAAESISNDGYSILDLGCGDGRLLIHLSGKFALNYSVGVDIAAVAIERFVSSIPLEQRAQIHARVADIFNLPPDIKDRRFDLVTFGDATVNFILDDHKLEELLSIAKAQLRHSHSQILLAVLADETPEKLAFMDNRCTVIPFRQKNGQASLIWWAYKFDAENLIMRRSAFVQDSVSAEGDIEGVICDLHDRMWTPSSIGVIAERCGLEIEKVFDSQVQDGAAIGMATSVVVLRQT